MNDHTYIFAGRVVPERALLDVSEVRLHTSATEDVPEGDLFIEVLKSQISARFIGSAEVTNIFTLRNIVEDSARMLLDVAGYFYGYGYDVEIVQMIRPSTSQKQIFGIDVPALKGMVATAGIQVNDIFKALAKPQGDYLRHALADLREAIKSPKDTGFFCYRAIESLKNSCIQRNQGADEGWGLFRTTYSLDKSEIMGIKAFADDVRHGNYSKAKGMTDRDRAETFRKTWNIVNKYILTENAS